MLFSHHSGWVKMEAQVVMAVLILSWAKLFQRESAALPHCWRAAFLLSFHLSPAAPIQPSIFVFISPCHLALTLKFIYALFLSFTLSLPLFLVFVFVFFSLLPHFYLPFHPHLEIGINPLVFPGPCWLQMENVWLNGTWVLCKQSYCMSSSHHHTVIQCTFGAPVILAWYHCSVALKWFCYFLV